MEVEAPVINNRLFLARFRQLLRDIELQISIIYDLNKLIQTNMCLSVCYNSQGSFKFESVK